MDSVGSILKSISIGLLVRSLFSGGFFVLSYYVSTTQNGIVDFDTKKIFEAALPIALFAGTIMYGIHRSIVYPALEFVFFDSCPGIWLRQYVPGMWKRTRWTALWRWNLTSFTMKAFNERLDKWADIIHQQYNAALCIWVGMLVAKCLDPSHFHFFRPLSCCATFLMVCAFFSNWRHYSFIEYVEEKGLMDTTALKVNPAAGDSGTANREVSDDD